MRYTKQYWTDGPGIDEVRDLARHGRSQAEIAEYIGVSESTFSRWCHVSPELQKSANTNPRRIDALVEDALFKRACGSQVVEEVWAPAADDDTRMVLVRRTVKDMPGDVQAQKFWLSNRRYEDWRMVQDPLETDAAYLDGVKNVLVTIERAADGCDADGAAS